jgi:hypothetical protein
VYHGGTVHRTLVRAVALVVACVVAWLPTLVRAHDRLSPHDSATSFRLSKNVERPHEKAAPAPVDRVAVPLVFRDDSMRRGATPAAQPLAVPAIASVLTTRAPPAR